jgi:ABC-type dipeptide/oligopeptide/nickel transport system permease subunit
MATRKQRLDFAAKRFKGFWAQFSKSKRGLVGIGIILIFSLVAVFAPFIATYKPIDPIMSFNQYQGLQTVGGPAICAPLAKPVWYKYLPWIPRGEINTTENFYSTDNTYEVSGNIVHYQTFTPVDATNVSTNTFLALTHRVAKVNRIDLTYENGTKSTMNSSDWDFAKVGLTSSTRELQVFPVYPDNTQVSVNYMTGTDLVENLKVVEDHRFSTPESFNVWNWQANSSSDLIDVRYNAEKGVIIGADQNQERGCVEITYNGATAPAEGIAVTLFKNFSYPYSEPPKSFFVHSSILFEPRSGADALAWNNVTLQILIMRESDAKEYLIETRPKALNMSQIPEYVADRGYSTEPYIATNVKTSPPQDGIFVASGNYKFMVRITIPPGSDTSKIYLDGLDCIIYGNVFGLMGSDNGVGLPRDIFSLLVWGSRVSLLVGILSALFSTLIGLFLGLVSGYVGGLIDEGIMRFADLLLVLPTLPLFIVLIVALRAVAGSVSMWNIIIVLTLFGWMGFARSVRSMVLSIRERAFIEAAKAAGAGRLHIINKHIVPNVFALVYITLATSVPGAIITEASLSWLGLGDPNTASWGKILYDFNISSIAVSAGLTEYWFWIFPACIAIAVLATAFILVGYALDEILNPRLRERR